MSRLIVVLISVVSLTAAVAPAAANSGNGPYAPFPAGGQSSQARQYYDELGVSVSVRRLNSGTFLGGLAARGAAGAVADRAGIAGDGAGLPALLVTLLTAGGVVVALKAYRSRTVASA